MGNGRSAVTISIIGDINMGKQYFGKNPTVDGMLWIDTDDDVWTVGNPKWGGSSVGNLMKYTITKWKSKSNSPLFKQKEMSIGDIKQEGVGDCWYLAALVAIINHPNGSDLLRKTMVDCGNGRVIVRFFDGDYMPVFLSIRKSVAWYLGPGKIHASGLSKTGLWPAMLEKAACCMKKDTEWKDCDPQHPHYKNIEGGNSHHAFRMLLGVGVDSISVKGMNSVGKIHGDKSAIQHLKLLFSTGNWTFKPGKNERDALNAIFGWLGMSVQRWQEILKTLKLKRSVLLYGAEGVKINSSTIRLNFFQLMNSPGLTGLPRDVSRVLAAYAKSQNIFSGNSGTGQYSNGADGVFNRIRSNLAIKKPMCFGTVKNVGPIEGRGHSGGEGMSRGMVGGHAYAILDCFEENVLSRRKYIKVANPWGQYGRSYIDNDPNLRLTPQEQKCGAFWLELTDFCDIIDSLYICEQDPGEYIGFL